jgi:hypothetical protein
MTYNPSVLDREENGALKLHLKKSTEPKLPRIKNKTQENARRARQAQHINDKKRG